MFSRCETEETRTHLYNISYNNKYYIIKEVHSQFVHGGWNIFRLGAETTKKIINIKVCTEVTETNL